jgi:hypothetical protein
MLDLYWGETVKTFSVLKEKDHAVAEEVIEYCQKKMTRHKVPAKGDPDQRNGLQ